MPLGNTSNLPTIQRIKFEDYNGAPKWFEQFLMTLNLFLSAIYNIVNRGITYTNIGVIAPFTFQFTPGSTVGFKFINPIIVSPTNIIIGNVSIGNQLTNHPSAVTQIYWHYTGGFIFVDSIVGLTTGITYSISVQVS